VPGRAEVRSSARVRRATVASGGVVVLEPSKTSSAGCAHDRVGPTHRPALRRWRDRRSTGCSVTLDGRARGRVVARRRGRVGHAGEQLRRSDACEGHGRRDGTSRRVPVPSSRSTARSELTPACYPACRTARRCRVALGEVDGVDPRTLPDADAVGRGWRPPARVARTAGRSLPPPVGDLVDAARCRSAPAAAAPPPRERGRRAFEGLVGFDHEAASTVGAVSVGGRADGRGRREHSSDPWAAVRAANATDGPAGFLGALRAALVREHAGALELASPAFPTDWLGQSLTVDGIPLPFGVTLVRGAVEHGAANGRCCGECRRPVSCCGRAPRSIPRGSFERRAVGETLLAEPPAPLLPMGTQERSSGAPIETPPAVLVRGQAPDPEGPRSMG